MARAGTPGRPGVFLAALSSPVRRVAPVDQALQRIKRILAGAKTRVEVARVAHAAGQHQLGHRLLAAACGCMRPIAALASGSSQARVSSHSRLNAFTRLWPMTTGPWLCSSKTGLPAARQRRGARRAEWVVRPVGPGCGRRAHATFTSLIWITGWASV